jgi:hypothetical protein
MVKKVRTPERLWKEKPVVVNFKAKTIAFKPSMVDSLRGSLFQYEKGERYCEIGVSIFPK